MTVGKVDLNILRMGQNGEGVATLPDGRIVFVAGALPGETVRAEITEERKTFARARVCSIIDQSSDREPAPCPVFNQCGGCDFQHWRYAAELAYKQAWIGESLARIGHLSDVSIRPIIGAENPYGYRNKGQFPWGTDRGGHPILGLYARGSHRLVQVSSCAIQSGVINRILAVAPAIAGELGLSIYQEKGHRGTLRHLLVRSAKDGSGALVALIVKDRDPRLVHLAEALMTAVPEVVGVVENVNVAESNRVLGDQSILLAGRPYFLDTILGQTFRVSTRTFFQVNPYQVEHLYDTVRQAVSKTAREVWDLYAGVGTVACLVAPHVKSVRAVEVNASAVKDAIVNANLNHLDNVRVDAASVEQWLSQKPDTKAVDAIIVDPPRAGLNSQAVQSLNQLAVKQLIYVSCNPDTLARDLNLLRVQYKVEWIQPVDMFPETDHVECCVVLRRSEDRHG